MLPRFSRRASHDDAPNALALAVLRAKAEGRALVDLTISNPTTAGIPYEDAAILRALADPRAMTYEPLALGLASARAHAAATFDVGLAPEHVALTASTSEAYAMLFTLLCDPGDEVLVPAPSYPLFDFLAAFHDVRLVRYPLVHAGAWHVDLDAMRAAITERTRAILVVTPNNPTGSYLGKSELDAMLATGLPIVSDEVFARYPLGDGDGVPEHRVDTVLRADTGLVFALSGLSKMCALPQMKLGFVGVGGAPALVTAAMARLEIVLDAYLSVATPVQHALPELLARTASTRTAIRERTRTNMARLRTGLAGSVATVLSAEGGWYAMVRVPDTTSDEAWAVELVERHDVHVHPGYFFDMTRGAHLVVSLLPEPETFAAGVSRLAEALA